MYQVAKVLELVSSSDPPMNIQDWFPLELTGLISLQSKGLPRVFSNTTVQKHQFFSTQPSLWSNLVMLAISLFWKILHVISEYHWAFLLWELHLSVNKCHTGLMYSLRSSLSSKRSVCTPDSHSSVRVCYLQDRVEIEWGSGFPVLAPALSSDVTLDKFLLFHKPQWSYFWNGVIIILTLLGSGEGKMI